MKLNPACVGCFASLSCKSRIEIINFLQKRGKSSVLEITKHFKLTQPTISHHLKYLKRSGILSSEKKGKEVFYFIDLKCKQDVCHIF